MQGSTTEPLEWWVKEEHLPKVVDGHHTTDELLRYMFTVRLVSAEDRRPKPVLAAVRYADAVFRILTNAR